MYNFPKRAKCLAIANKSKIDLNSKVKDVSLQVDFDSQNNLYQLIILGQDQGREFKIIFNDKPSLSIKIC